MQNPRVQFLDRLFVVPDFSGFFEIFRDGADLSLRIIQCRPNMLLDLTQVNVLYPLRFGVDILLRPLVVQLHRRRQLIRQLFAGAPDLISEVLTQIECCLRCTGSGSGLFNRYLRFMIKRESTHQGPSRLFYLDAEFVTELLDPLNGIMQQIGKIANKVKSIYIFCHTGAAESYE